MKKYFLLIFLVVLGCATSPTGRNQFIMISDDQMTQMGRQSFSEIKQKTRIEYEARINNYVKCVANAIVNVSRDKTGVSNWEIVVFKDETANAFALPGGKIGVHTGILKVAASADQLAAVLGHEVGHVIARHGAERVSEGLATQTGLAVVDVLLDKKSQSHGLIMAGLGLGAQYGVMLPFSRKHESEADEIGLDLMAKAGFRPEESVELWHNMARASGGGAPPEFMSTHPANQTRIENLQSHMAEARQTFQHAQASGHTPNCGSL
jgi:predicted Zn-dependent protease